MLCRPQGLLGHTALMKDQRTPVNMQTPRAKVSLGTKTSVYTCLFLIHTELVLIFKQVRYLKIIEKSGYQALPWVRYITQNGDYQLRTQ
ncbi:AP-1 complex subunit mu-1 [Tachysurus ichikawai]